MRPFKVASILCLLLLLLVAFKLKYTHSVFQSNYPVFVTDTGKHILCRPTSRSAAFKNTKIYPVSMHNETAEMVWIAAGTFQMGSDEFPDSKPVHAVSVKGFWMDEHEVSNAQFAKFVEATNYITVAEKALNPSDFPDVPVDKLLPGSAVFIPATTKISLDNPLRWWQYIIGANWRHPQGPSSSIEGKDGEPVVQVCYTDAVAYAKWAGKRLPTEAEWEFAAQGGKKRDKYYWGDELTPGGKWVANIYEGSFPDHNTLLDGFATTSPVKSFKPNPYGLYDMEGNVWEWCDDFYRPDYYLESPVVDPKGPKESFDPEEPGQEKHVQRGGSFLCSDEYCNRYKAGSRGKGETNSAGNNLGFRCVKDVITGPGTK